MPVLAADPYFKGLGRVYYGLVRLPNIDSEDPEAVVGWLIVYAVIQSFCVSFCDTFYPSKV
jgi:hypothetical protein